VLKMGDRAREGGTVALDGTKIHANASPHSAPSDEHAGKIETQRNAEEADLLNKAETTDQADIPDGMCGSEPKWDLTSDIPQHLEIPKGMPFEVGSRSAPVGTPAVS
jgi:hypothetical protein